jgi:hypothetical protein
VQLGPAIDQDVVWPNSAIACADDWTEAPLLRRGTAQFHVLCEIDAPRMGVAGSHHMTSKSGLEKLGPNGNSVKFLRLRVKLACRRERVVSEEETLEGSWKHDAALICLCDASVGSPYGEFAPGV